LRKQHAGTEAQQKNGRDPLHSFLQIRHTSDGGCATRAIVLISKENISFLVLTFKMREKKRRRDKIPSRLLFAEW
jgi:hypothetical protein